jgi:hypothetical protein
MSQLTATIQMSVSLPARLVEELQRYILPTQREQFIAQAIERELNRLRLQEALADSAGAWQAQDHPELSDGSAIDHWLADRRTVLGWTRPQET